MNNRMTAREHAASIFICVAILIGVALTTNGFAGATEHPCAASSENRQLDYWIGNWNIGSLGSAHSTVTLSLDECLVIENWDGGRGH